MSQPRLLRSHGFQNEVEEAQAHANEPDTSGENGEEETIQSAPVSEPAVSSGSRASGKPRRGSGSKARETGNDEGGCAEAEAQDEQNEEAKPRSKRATLPRYPRTRGSSRSVAIPASTSTPTPPQFTQRTTRSGKAQTRVAAPLSVTSSVSMGEWADDSNSAGSTSVLGPRLRARAARARQSTSGSSKSGLSESINASGSGTMSSLTEPSEELTSSPSLGGTHALDIQTSPSLGGADLLDSPFLGGTVSLSTRSDAGATHVSDSVEGTQISETTGGEMDDLEAEVAVMVMKGRKTRSQRVVAVRDFGFEHGNRGQRLRSTKDTMEVVLPSPERQTTLGGGQTKRSRSPAKVQSQPAPFNSTSPRAMPMRLATSSTRPVTQLYVLLPRTSASQKEQWTAFEAHAVDKNAYGPRGRESEVASLNEAPSVDGEAMDEVEEPQKKGKGKQRGEPPVKRMRVKSAAEQRRVSSKDKGKGKAVAGEFLFTYQRLFKLRMSDRGIRDGLRNG
jgi:hypothetical protein